MIHREYDTEWAGETGIITGTAVYDVEVQTFFDSDIGGSDGPEATAELIRVEVDGLHLTRDQIALVVGNAAIERAEEIMAYEMEIN